MTLNAEQEQIMQRIRGHARDLAAEINSADAAGIGAPVLLPELITILRESGFTIPALPFGLFG